MIRFDVLFDSKHWHGRNVVDLDDVPIIYCNRTSCVWSLIANADRSNERALCPKLCIGESAIASTARLAHKRMRRFQQRFAED